MIELKGNDNQKQKASQPCTHVYFCNKSVFARNGCYRISSVWGWKAFCFWLSFPFNSLITNHKLSLMEDLKAILTVGAILVVPFIAAPKAMFAIVLYIIIYMAFRWRNF